MVLFVCLIALSTQAIAEPIACFAASTPSINASLGRILQSMPNPYHWNFLMNNCKHLSEGRCWNVYAETLNNLMTLVVEYYSTTLSSLTVVTVEFEFRPVVPSSNSNLSVVT